MSNRIMLDTNTTVMHTTDMQIIPDDIRTQVLADYHRERAAAAGRAGTGTSKRRSPTHYIMLADARRAAAADRARKLASRRERRARQHTADTTIQPVLTHPP